MLSLSWSSIRRNRLRSSLTIGAIAFGISVMMYLIALGFGLEQLTLGTVAQSNTLLSIDVTSPSEELQPLTAKSVAKIAAFDHVREVLPQFTVKGQVILDNSQTQATIIGADPDYLSLNDSSKLTSGRYYRPDDV